MFGRKKKKETATLASSKEPVSKPVVNKGLQDPPIRLTQSRPPLKAREEPEVKLTPESAEYFAKALKNYFHED